MIAVRSILAALPKVDAMADWSEVEYRELNEHLRASIRLLVSVINIYLAAKAAALTALFFVFRSQQPDGLDIVLIFIGFLGVVWSAMLLNLVRRVKLYMGRLAERAAAIEKRYDLDTVSRMLAIWNQGAVYRDGISIHGQSIRWLEVVVGAFLFGWFVFLVWCLVELFVRNAL